MTMDDPEVRGSIEGRPIQRRDDMIERLIGCLPSHIHHGLLIQPQACTRRAWART